jgi:hypothetical protein
LLGDSVVDFDDLEARRSIARRVFAVYPVGREIEGIEELRESAGEISRRSILGKEPYREPTFGLPGRMAYFVSHACLSLVALSLPAKADPRHRLIV